MGSKGFTCEICNCSFRSKYNLKRHLLKADILHNKKIRIICPFEECNDYFHRYSVLNKHLKDKHNQKLQCKRLEFSTEKDFSEWKNKFEQATYSNYVKDTSGKVTKGCRRFYYNCHRSFKYRENENKLGASKGVGSNKIDRACPSRLVVERTCPSRLVVERTSDFRYSVEVWTPHIGHLIKIKQIHSTSDVSVDFEDEIKSEDELRKIHLMNKEELNSISGDNKISKDDSKFWLQDNEFSTVFHVDKIEIEEQNIDDIVSCRNDVEIIQETDDNIFSCSQTISEMKNIIKQKAELLIALCDAENLSPMQEDGILKCLDEALEIATIRDQNSIF